MSTTASACRPIISWWNDLSSQHAYYGANLARMVEVKRRYDPEDVFRFPQGIPLSLGEVASATPQPTAE